jgi:hypothetical protein
MTEAGLWGDLSVRSLYIGTFAFVRTLSSFPGLNYIAGIRTFFMFAPWWEKALFIFYYGVLGGMIGYISLLLILRWRMLYRRQLQPLCMFGISGILYCIFALYWIAADIQFWTPLTVSWWGGMALLLRSYKRESEDKPRKLSSSVPEIVVAVLVCTIGVVNFAGTILPNTSAKNNIEYMVALSLKDKVRNNDLVITTGVDRVFLYVPYFVKKDVLSIFLVGMNKKTPERVVQEIDRRIEAAVAQGGDVYFVGMRPGKFVLWKEMDKLGIDQSIFKRYDVSPCMQVEDEEILKLNVGKKGMLLPGRMEGPAHEL